MAQEQVDPSKLAQMIEYSEKYQDDIYEYRHVILPKELAKSLQAKRLLAENEWSALGVQQSRGWAHYAIHRPEPHILLFRRELGTDPMTGKVSLVTYLTLCCLCLANSPSISHCSKFIRLTQYSGSRQ